MPSSERPAADFAGDGLPLLEALVDGGLVKSKGEARRLIRQGGVRVNGEAVSDETARADHGGRAATAASPCRWARRSTTICA